MEDLFETPELWPTKLRKILDAHSQDDNTYENCQTLEAELKPLGYTFEWGLDAVPFNLRKIDP